MQGCRGALGALQQQRRQAGGGQARGRARRAHAPRPSGERRDTTGIGQLGWAAQCWISTGAGPVGGRQVSPSLSLFYLVSVFYLCYFVLI